MQRRRQQCRMMSSAHRSHSIATLLFCSFSFSVFSFSVLLEIDSYQAIHLASKLFQHAFFERVEKQLQSSLNACHNLEQDTHTILLYNLVCLRCLSIAAERRHAERGRPTLCPSCDAVSSCGAATRARRRWRSAATPAQDRCAVSHRLRRSTRRSPRRDHRVHRCCRPHHPSSTFSSCAHDSCCRAASCFAAMSFSEHCSTWLPRLCFRHLVCRQQCWNHRRCLFSTTFSDFSVVLFYHYRLQHCYYY
mmetsp:Transcript_10855/g.18150  ORF Transcript_10855/g.18150 Transcript_10855/m.18150 type:complete len:248 (-) Transcript_10855:734-1477(-)